MEFAIGGISVAALIVGIVEAAKSFGLEGNGSRILALVLGFFFTGLAYGIGEGMLPEVAVPYIVWVVTALGGSLAACGYYDLARKLLK